MAFRDFSTKEEFLIPLLLKTTTKGVDLYSTVKDYFVAKKVPVGKMVSVTTDKMTTMTGQNAYSCKFNIFGIFL